MASSSSSQDFFDLIPMESESAESSMSFMPLDSESPLPELELVIDTGHVDSSSDSFDESVFETVAESATRPMKSGDIWIDGDSIMTVCPDCSAPISIRHWLMHANCWRCGTVVQLTAWQEAQVRRLLNESDDVEEAEIATAQVQPAVVFKKPKPTLAYVDIRQQAVTDQLRLWAKRLLRNTPAWLSSFLIHLILLIMMGLIDQTSQIESPAITLSVEVDTMDQEGGNIVETNYDQEEEYELPLPEDVDPEDVEQMENVFKVNFFGTVNCIKAVEQYFRDKKKGIIAIVSSIAGYRGLPNSTGYGPSKSALNNLAESLYFDFKRYNVRVCLVSPGFIKTPMTDKNDFKMPFLKTPEYAADQIYEGLVNKNIFEIHFPKSLTITLKLLSFLPSKIYFGLVGKLTKYQKK